MTIGIKTSLPLGLIGLGFYEFGAKESVVKDFVDKRKPSDKGGGDDV